MFSQACVSHSVHGEGVSASGSKGFSASGLGGGATPLGHTSPLDTPPAHTYPLGHPLLLPVETATEAGVMHPTGMHSLLDL